MKPDVAVAPELALLEAHRLAAETLAAAGSDARQSEALRAIAAGLAEQKRIAGTASPAALTKSQKQLVGRYAPVGGIGPVYSVVEGHLVLQPSDRAPSRLEQVSAGASGRVARRLHRHVHRGSRATPLVLQQSNAWSPLLLEQQ